MCVVVQNVNKGVRQPDSDRAVRSYAALSPQGTEPRTRMNRYFLDHFREADRIRGATRSLDISADVLVMSKDPIMPSRPIRTKLGRPT